MKLFLLAQAPRHGSAAIKEGSSMIKDPGYPMFSLAEKGTDFIAPDKTKPFFLTLSFNETHDSFQLPERYYKRKQGRKDPVKPVYSGMIEALDKAAGTVLKKLQQA